MSDEKDLKLEPTDGLCYNPNLPLYWDEAALKKELDRSFELCHSCRASHQRPSPTGSRGARTAAPWPAPRDSSAADTTAPGP